MAAQGRSIVWVPLAEAVECHLSSIWLPFEQLFENGDEARAKFFLFTLDLSATLTAAIARKNPCEANLKELELAQHAHAIAKELRTRLQSGAFHATGLAAPDPERKVIPREFWASMRMNLKTNTAAKRGYTFECVLVGGTSIDVDAVVSWLRLQETTERKVLEHRARQKFPGLPNRVFSAAYSTFGKARGRPRNSSGK
jgi:hypothetical protein